mgnify:FL=1
MSSLFKLPTTYSEFLNEFSPKLLDAIMADIRTIDDTIEKERTTLLQLEESYGLKDAVDYIDRWLQVLNGTLNIRNPLVETTKIAFKIYDRFSHLYITDLKLVSDKILFGDGVQFYGSVDAQAILKAFGDYNIERKGKIYEKYKKSVIPKVESYSEDKRTMDREAIKTILDRNAKLFGGKNE